MTTFDLPTPHAVLELTMTDGATIRVRRHGNANADRRLILAHGNGFAIDAYFPFWRHFLEDYDLAIYDQRNHGWNPRTEEAAHDVDFFVADMTTVADGIAAAFGAKWTGAMFHSISGITSIKHAQDVGWRWDALVLFDPPMIPSPGHPLHETAQTFELRLADWAAARPNRFPSKQAYADGMAEQRAFAMMVSGAHDLMARSILRDCDDGSGEVELCCPGAYESRVYRTNAYLDLTPRLGELPGPVMFIGSDPELEGARAPGLVNRAMHEEHGHPWTPIPGTSHLLQIEKPEACAEAAKGFLAGV